MKTRRSTSIAVAAAMLCSAMATGAHAQKPGGTLRIQHWDTPANMSMLEANSISTAIPMAQVFNGLVVYDQNKPINSAETIQPELAESWQWNGDGTKLTFKLRPNVLWHDGKPFTAADVKCTFDLMLGKAKPGLRVNPRATWFWNIQDVVPDDNLSVTLHLKQPQPALLSLLAASFSAMYPCHVNANEMRTRPIGTGPYRFLEFRQGQHIKLKKNDKYWKPGKPFIDEIEYKTIPNLATAQLALSTGDVDMTFPFTTTLPLLDELKGRYPKAECVVEPTNTAPFVLINPTVAPFDNEDVRRAIVLTIDRQAMIDILSFGKFYAGGAMLPPPEGRWGLTPEELSELPGFEPDIAKRRELARELMKKAGFGPDKRISVKLATRNVQSFRDPAVILLDQLKEIWIDAELDLIETAVFLPKITRLDYQLSVNHQGNAIDEPDQALFEVYVCGGRSYTNYCDKETEALIYKQSRTIDQAERAQIVKQIDKRVQEQFVRPVLFWQRAATCWRPEVKNVTVGSNSIYNSWRMEDWWLDR